MVHPQRLDELRFEPGLEDVSHHRPREHVHAPDGGRLGALGTRGRRAPLAFLKLALTLTVHHLQVRPAVARPDLPPHTRPLAMLA
eukprot:5632131-Pyramimonas_sp.AAC.1